MDKSNPTVSIILTVYKRNHLIHQLQAVHNQSYNNIKNIVVFQNENHVNLTNLKQKFNFIHIHNDLNTKYFGRFAFGFNLNTDIIIVLDDDVIPGNNCIKNMVQQCVEKNAIIGANGRIAISNSNKYLCKQPPDVGKRESQLVDFVGHIWVFRKEWLYYMFRDPPFTYDTGEDQQLCFSSKVYGDINSYVCSQLIQCDLSDLAMNQLADDEHASFKLKGHSCGNGELRIGIENYWVQKGLKFIDSN